MTEIKVKETMTLINKSELEDLKECVRKGRIFFDDVLSQFGGISLEDYQNMNEVGILFDKIKRLERVRDNKLFDNQ
jgi:hypothetical protein